MKKLVLLVMTATLGLTPVAGAARTTAGHGVRQYVQNRVSHWDRNLCRKGGGHEVKSHGKLVCVKRHK